MAKRAIEAVEAARTAGDNAGEEIKLDFNSVHKESCYSEEFAKGHLAIIVLGASGDLAKKKTFPSLLDLFAHDFLPTHVSIIGYARSDLKNEDFHQKIRSFLENAEKDSLKIDNFLKRTTYCKGNYDSVEDFTKLDEHIMNLEKSMENGRAPPFPSVSNRLFYFAIPPNAFLSSAQSIKASALSKTGFNRLIVEKPFGHDLASAEKLVADLGNLFDEEHIYRIDHYLAKEIVQNLYIYRFGNLFLEPTFNNNYVSNVQITFKEPFGTEGRGGYFTHYGIIRDVIQNHLMQVLSIVAMECPTKVAGAGAGNHIRDAKNRVLMAIEPIKPDEVVLGQYVGADGKPGYLEDDSIKEEDREKAKYVPTFAAVVLRINTPRWHGVPFIVKAGKALNERKVEVRVQFKSAPATAFVFDGQHCARNELVMCLQPDESVYMKINVKQPGMAQNPIQSDMDLSYKERYEGIYSPDAYTRLILEALRGTQGNFVRSDELLNSWKLFDPLLAQLEKRVPEPYKYGSRGLNAADELVKSMGYTYETGYVWKPKDKGS